MKINQTLFDAGCLSFRIPNPSLVRPFFIANMTSVNNFNEKKKNDRAKYTPSQNGPQKSDPRALGICGGVKTGPYKMVEVRGATVILAILTNVKNAECGRIQTFLIQYTIHTPNHPIVVVLDRGV